MALAITLSTGINFRRETLPDKIYLISSKLPEDEREKIYKSVGFKVLDSILFNEEVDINEVESLINKKLEENF